MRAGLDERRGERDGDTLTLKGELLDPMSKQPADVRLVTRVVGKDHHVFEMYMTLQGVPEFKMMQIDYVREGGDWPQRRLGDPSSVELFRATPL